MSARQARNLLSYLRRSSVGFSSSDFVSSEHLYRYQRHSRSFFRSREFLSEAKEAPARFSRSPFIPTPPRVDSGEISKSAAAGKLGLVNWYLRMLNSRPVLTKSVTAGIIFTAADLSAQTISGSSDSFDLIRTSRMACYGILISGPSLHFWFNFLSRVLPKRDILTTLKKMCLGQTVYGPFICSVFFSLNAFLQGETSSEILSRLKRDLPPTILNGLAYWPICDFITFRFIPVHLQPLVSNSFSFLWTIYLTYMASLAKADELEA